MHSKMSAISSNLDQFKILSSGDRLIALVHQNLALCGDRVIVQKLGGSGEYGSRCVGQYVGRSVAFMSTLFLVFNQASWKYIY